MKYILSEKSEECPFCEKANQKKDKENYILLRGKRTFIILNTFPYNNGHLMVVPYRHLANLEELNQQELSELTSLVMKGVTSLKEAFNPDGFNIGLNLGEAAGAGIKDHLHIHIVPRWSGDNNFMPVVADTKVIMESLDDTYKKLSKTME
jgi:ATP adenylyltransferase